MHHIIVSRVSLTFCLLLAGGTLGFALLADSGPTAEPAGEAAGEGAALFDAHCGGCHTVDELAPGLRDAEDPAARMAELEAFLENHGRASPEQDRAILEYLADRS